MKETLLTMMEQIQEDATFYIYVFDEYGRFRCEFKEKPYVMNLLKEAEFFKLHHYLHKVRMINRQIGIIPQCFSDNIDYETKGTEEFIEHICKYNPYKKVYIKLDVECKTITFKLGDKEKQLELIEHTDYVCKAHNEKHMKCVTIENLKSHIENDFWSTRMVSIGRDVLGLKDLSFT